MAEAKPPSRSEREAHIKDKAGWVITVLAALLAINTLVGGSNSSKILNNTIQLMILGLSIKLRVLSKLPTI